MNAFNKLIAEYKDNDITKLMDELYILNYKDGHSVAFSKRRLDDDDLTEENKAKILNSVKPVDLDIDTSFTIESTKSGTMSYFDNKKIMLKEKEYSCRKKSLMSLVSQCKHKLIIKFNNKSVKLKDTKRDVRISYKDGEKFKGDLYDYLPNSRYITDKNSNIYLIFRIKDEKNLIKLSIN